MKYKKGIVINFETLVALAIFLSSFSVFEYGYIINSHLIYLKAIHAGNNMMDNLIAQKFVYSMENNQTDVVFGLNDSSYTIYQYPQNMQNCCNLKRIFALNDKMYALSVNNNETANSN